MLTRVAVVSDIHGLAPALHAVLEEIDRLGVELVVFGGDVAAGPMPIETIEMLHRYPHPKRFVQGNADRAMVEIYDDARNAPDTLAAWSATQLSRSQRDFLAAFESTVEIKVGELGAVLCCHAGPLSDEYPIVTPATPDEVMAEVFEHTTASVVVAGHTHMQFDRTVGGRRMVNAGSVGMPYARDPGAYWALLGQVVDLRCTSYDVHKAAKAVLSTQFPQREATAKALVDPPTPEEAIEVFEKQAGRRSRTR